jgi:hypothetical protein
LSKNGRKNFLKKIKKIFKNLLTNDFECAIIISSDEEPTNKSNQRGIYRMNAKTTNLLKTLKELSVEMHDLLVANLDVDEDVNSITNTVDGITAYTTKGIITIGYEY